MCMFCFFMSIFLPERTRQTIQGQDEFSRAVRSEPDAAIIQLLAGSRVGRQTELIVHPGEMIRNAVRRDGLHGRFLPCPANHIPGPAQGFSLSIHTGATDVGFTANNRQSSATAQELRDTEIRWVQFLDHRRTLGRHGRCCTVGQNQHRPDASLAWP